MKASLLKELQYIRKNGVHHFSARNSPLLALACGAPEKGEAPEVPIRQRLKELLDADPPTDEHGHVKPLEKRDRKDHGLLGLVVFGEPGALGFAKAGPEGTDLILRPRDLSLTHRYRELERLRNEGTGTIDQPPKSDRKKLGPAYELMLDLRDALFPEVQAALAPEASSANAAITSKLRPSLLATLAALPHRQLTLLALASTLFFTLVLAFVLLVLPKGGNTNSADPSASAMVASRCAQLAKEATETPEGRGYPSTGAYERGDFVRAAHSPTGRYEDPLEVDPGGTVRVMAQLSNTGPETIRQTCVRASAPTHSSPDPAISIHLITPYANPSRTSNTVSLAVRDEGAACIRLLPGTTEFQAHSGSVLANLANQVFGEGVVVGAVDVPLEDARYVAFKVHLDPHPADQPC